MKISSEHTVNKESAHLNYQKYKIIGFPFFNRDGAKQHQFEEYFKEFIETI